MLRIGLPASLLIAAAFIPSFAWAQTDPYRVSVGELHPPFVLPAIDDQRAVAWSQFRGKKVLLIHFASW